MVIEGYITIIVYKIANKDGFKGVCKLSSKYTKTNLEEMVQITHRVNKKNSII